MLMLGLKELTEFYVTTKIASATFQLCKRTSV